MEKIRVVLCANTDWYLFNFRRSLADRLRNDHGAEVICLCPDGPYRPRLEAEGYLWREVRMDCHGISPGRDLALCLQLTKAFNELRPTLLHNFTIKPVIWGSLAAWFAGVPFTVNAFTGLGATFQNRSLRSRVAKWVVTLLLQLVTRLPNTRFIFQNPEDQALIQRLTGLPGERTAIIPGSGVDTIRFHPAAVHPIPPVVLFVGRLLRDKGILVFCEMAKLVRMTRPEVVFWIAGEADLGNPDSLSPAEIQALANANPWLHFLGHVEHMASLYPQVSLVVLPSRGEGVPRSLVEAAACGKPLVATRVPGCQDIVEHGGNGLLVERPGPLEVKAAVLEILGDEAKAASFGKRGRQLVLDRFSEERVNLETIRSYGWPIHPKPRVRPPFGEKP